MAKARRTNKPETKGRPPKEERGAVLREGGDARLGRHVEKMETLRRNATYVIQTRGSG